MSKVTDARAPPATLRDAVRRAVDALQRLARLLALAPAPRPAPLFGAQASAGVGPVPVAVLPVAHAALADAARRWPRLAFSCTPAAPAEDTAIAEVSGGAQTTIKGGIVMIN